MLGGRGGETHAHMNALGWAAMKLHDSMEGTKLFASQGLICHLRKREMGPGVLAWLHINTSRIQEVRATHSVHRQFPGLGGGGCLGKGEPSLPSVRCPKVLGPVKDTCCQA